MIGIQTNLSFRLKILQRLAPFFVVMSFSTFAISAFAVEPKPGDQTIHNDVEPKTMTVKPVGATPEKEPDNAQLPEVVPTTKVDPASAETPTLADPAFDAEKIVPTLAAGETFVPTLPALQQKLLETIRYNVYVDLPKIGLKHEIMEAPVKKFAYGPFQYDPIVYTGAFPALEALIEKIHTLEEVVIKEGETDPAVLDKRIYLADLYNIKYQITHKEEDYATAIEKYTRAYKDLTAKYFGIVALNMCNLMIQHGDTITAMPILKKIYKDNFSENNQLLKRASTCLLNLYFLEGRYEKGYELFAPKLKKLELENETIDYKMRVGDLLFFLKKYQDASEWYQNVLKPRPDATPAENLSWLYLAEALFMQGKLDPAKRIYQAMQPFFTDTPYATVIAYRLAADEEAELKIMQDATESRVVHWMKLDQAQKAYLKNPVIFTADYFTELLKDAKATPAISDILDLILADIAERDGDFYTSLQLYRNLELKNKDPFIDSLYTQIVIGLLMKQGYQNNTEQEARQYLTFLNGFEFYLQSADADKVYDLLHFNLSKMGMESAAAELTLHIIDRTMKTAADKARLYLKLAQAFHESRAFHSSLRALDVIDVKLLPFGDRQSYYELMVNANLALDRMLEALQVLNDWAKQGYSAKDSYWIALKKVEINSKYKKYDDAIAVIDDTIGNGKVNALPPEYDEIIMPLIAQQVILDNRVGRHNECLVAFYSYQEKLLSSEYKSEVILAAISSALSMNKNKDIEKILNSAKAHMDPKTYEWLNKWARGEMWIQQVDLYLDQATAMTGNREQGASHVQ